jgi:hypothetical protein
MPLLLVQWTRCRVARHNRLSIYSLRFPTADADNGGMTDGPVAEPDIKSLAAELSKARQRGIDNLDEKRADKPTIALPVLELLARNYVGDPAANRVPAIQALLAAALDAYAIQKNAAEADLIRRLFKDDAGRWPGLRGTGALTLRPSEGGGVGAWAR